MPLYRGERTTICHTATVDKVALAPVDVDGVFVTVYAPDYLSIVLDEVEMTWNAGKTRWEYGWLTAAVDPATYHIKVRILGADGQSAWEYSRLKVTKDPALV
jgi:hypothetical protein